MMSCSLVTFASTRSSRDAHGDSVHIGEDHPQFVGKTQILRSLFAQQCVDSGVKTPFKLPQGCKRMTKTGRQQLAPRDRPRRRTPRKYTISTKRHCKRDIYSPDTGQAAQQKATSRDDTTRQVWPFVLPLPRTPSPARREAVALTPIHHAHGCHVYGAGKRGRGAEA